jgi:DNA-binding MurR/RpiR family transcriptional regulator
MLFLNDEVDLKPTEMEIYNYINANLDKVVYMRIRELADATFVSTTTILRFCKKFGCQGYSDFRVRLLDYRKSIRENNRLIQELDETVFIEYFKRTAYHDFKNLIQKATDIILESDLLFFVGTGTSGVMATYGSILFSSLFTFSLPVIDPQNSPVYYLPDQLDNHICLIVFSVTGHNAEVSDYINRFRVHPIKIISITNSANSQIAKSSDLNIPYYINTEMYQDTNITSQIPVVYILERLSREVYYQKHLQNQV